MPTRKIMPTGAIQKHFSSIPEPGVKRGKKHKLIITLCGVISGAP
jgi:hypothetical protein